MTMKKNKWLKMIDQFCVPPGAKVRLKDYNPGWMGGKEFKGFTKEDLKQRAQAFLQERLTLLAEAQALLWANDTYSVLMVLQAMDAAGKDSTIKHVMSGINPQGCQVFSFKAPTSEELDHNWLWRYMKSVPQRGRICIFNRSHYEDVLVVKVHPEFLEKQRLPAECLNGKTFWEDRYQDINAFERHLARNGTVILKFFLNVSRKEQKRRFLERLETPAKNWKFSAADIAERAYWPKYQAAFEDALSATSTKWAPWHVIPADHKWIARALVSEVITRTIRRLGLKPPVVTPQRLKELATARRALLREK